MDFRFSPKKRMIFQKTGGCSHIFTTIYSENHNKYFICNYVYHQTCFKAKTHISIQSIVWLSKRQKKKPVEHWRIRRSKRDTKSNKDEKIGNINENKRIQIVRRTFNKK